ncbi:hypothetical protein CUPS4244_07105 [Campylobacter upsaliensis]|uniref:hypothetical protein n=1 Tax=Campylobacter upsaliensis TaxID=28080 RepID=UPI00214A5E9E|nr:hypothetical protein [Campylobacter upsaliensis]MCR2104845.1 hypothetical protein [Campylobacter upsaliensis]
MQILKRLSVSYSSYNNRVGSSSFVDLGDWHTPHPIFTQIIAPFKVQFAIHTKKKL